mmetsp:Transcript_11800/g.26754  ORF Transcript_11800/g.26754 Transcript_11800/m.26754 type:complete len:99 (-) Transcript_11800:23-319(-)
MAGSTFAWPMAEALPSTTVCLPHRHRACVNASSSLHLARPSLWPQPLCRVTVSGPSPATIKEGSVIDDAGGASGLRHRARAERIVEMRLHKSLKNPSP